MNRFASCSAAALAVIVATTAAHAGRLDTLAQLENFLTDQIEIEDLEGLSLHAGGSVTTPNPLNSVTGPTFGLNEGITYVATPGPLTLFGGSTNVLRTDGTIEIIFDEAQLAVGLIQSSSTGDVTVKSGETVLGTFNMGASGFIGWIDGELGITSIAIIGPVSIDNITFGVPLTGGDYCPGDCEGSGDVAFDDLICILFDFGNSGAGASTDCDLSGTIDFNDLICALFKFGPCD